MRAKPHPHEHPSSQVTCLGKGRHRAHRFCSRKAVQKDPEVLGRQRGPTSKSIIFSASEICDTSYL